MTLLFEVFATIISLIGCVFIIRKSRWGYAVWLVANIGWMGFAITVDAWWLFITQLSFAVMSVAGFVAWSLGARRPSGIEIAHMPPPGGVTLLPSITTSHPEWVAFPATPSPLDEPTQHFGQPEAHQS